MIPPQVFLQSGYPWAQRNNSSPFCFVFLFSLPHPAALFAYSWLTFLYFLAQLRPSMVSNGQNLSPQNTAVFSKLKIFWTVKELSASSTPLCLTNALDKYLESPLYILPLGSGVCISTALTACQHMQNSQTSARMLNRTHSPNSGAFLLTNILVL